MRTTRRLALVGLLSALALPLNAAERPALVVVISVDQMRSDYLERFRPWFTRGGFNRFLDRGARFPEARYRHASTFTCPGHAAIGTGLDPRETGVIGNYWLDASRRRQYCVEDRSARWVGAPAGAPPVTTAPASPVLLGGHFLGDRLKEAYPGARVVALAVKDRAAVPMGGRKADAAAWFVWQFERFVTSSYYPPRPSLLAFNERLPALFARHREWKPSGRIPEEDLARVTFDPMELAHFKGALAGMGQTFPHPLTQVRSVVESPFGDTLLLDFARHAIRDFRLGRNPSKAPDLLFLGLSALDYYGHRYGPDSREVADGIVRLDAELASFFGWLDKQVGAGRTLFFLTGDHGVAPIPEIAAEKARRRGGERAVPYAGGRVDFVNPTGAAVKISDLPADRLELERHLAAKLGYRLDVTLPIPLEAAVLRFEDPLGMYLNRAVLDRRRLPAEGVKALVRDWLRARPGIRAAYTNTEVANGLPAGDPLGLTVERSFRADRSPDVLVYLAPGWIFRKEPGTTHGQPTEDDLRVPLLAFGPGVLRGSWDVRVSPLSIPRTIAALYGFEAGAQDVEVLQPVLGRAEETRRVAAP